MLYFSPTVTSQVYFIISWIIQCKCWCIADAIVWCNLCMFVYTQHSSNRFCACSMKWLKGLTHVVDLCVGCVSFTETHKLLSTMGQVELKQVLSESSSNRSPAKENIHIFWDESQLWSSRTTFDPYTFWIRDVRIARIICGLSLGFSQRASCVYFGGQIAASQQGDHCHHCDLRTQATSPRLQRRGLKQHMGWSVRRSKGREAAQHVYRCQEIPSANFHLLGAILEN